MTALANHVWQSTLFAGTVWLLTLILEHNRAAVRYWLWLSASVKFLIPFSLLVSLGSHLPWRSAAAFSDTHIAERITEIGQPFAAAAYPTIIAARSTSHLPVVLLTLWLCGILAGLIFWARTLLRIHAVKRIATPLDLCLAVPVLSSPARLEPFVFGIFNPILILPAHTTDRLTPAQLEAVLAHELCHVRRRDNLTAAIHMVVETIFWFHPLVWWIRTRLVAERERACDEEVLARSTDPRVYAEAILNVCKLYVESPMVCASGITGAELTRRVTRIMSPGFVRNLSLPRKLTLAAAAWAAVIGPVAAGLLWGQSTREFDAVSVKPYSPQGAISEACGSRNDPAMLRLVGCTLKQLVELAYDLKNYQVQLKGPAWIDTDLFVIQAHSTAPAAEREMMHMLQPVLAARFHLNVHSQDRQAPVYLMQAASRGPHLQAATKTNQCGMVNVRPTTFQSDCLTLNDFAEALEEFVVKDRPVINRTGVNNDNRYQFNLQYSVGDDPAADPTIFSVLPEQLGLTLKADKAPLRMLVIDRAERPQPN